MSCRPRRADAWQAWYRERAAAGDETVTRHPLPLAVMLRHREDPPGYVPEVTEVEGEPVTAPVIEAQPEDEPNYSQGLPDSFWDIANWTVVVEGPPRMAAE